MAKCECCGEETKKLERHHWHEPPLNGYKFFTEHAKAVCSRCNQQLVPHNFWAYPTFGHILPDWETQKYFVNQWKPENDRLHLSCNYLENNRLLKKHLNGVKEHIMQFLDSVTCRYIERLPILKGGTFYQQKSRLEMLRKDILDVS